MFKGKSKEVFQKTLIILGGVSFLWVTVSQMVENIMKPQTAPVEQSSTVSPQQQLKIEATGYEAVLKNEPNNSFALEQLLRINLELRDLPAALIIAEKLVKIKPENQTYQEVLSKIKLGLAQEKQQQPEQKTPSSP